MPLIFVKGSGFFNDIDGKSYFLSLPDFSRVHLKYVDKWPIINRMTTEALRQREQLSRMINNTEHEN